MTSHDEHPSMIDLIATFGRENRPAPKRDKPKAKAIVAAKAKTSKAVSAHERRLKANRLKPTLARTSVMSALEQAVPRCLDAVQVYRVLSSRSEVVVAQATIYRVLSDLWSAGLLDRTQGARGRALFALKPDRKDLHNDTLRCRCGTRLVFIEDRILRERLRSLAAQEGFDFGDDPAFTVTVMCAHCRRGPKESH